MALIVVLTNISGLAPVSDYNYQVLVGDGSEARSTVIAHGTVYGHERADGWEALVEALLDDQTMPEGN